MKAVPVAGGREVRTELAMLSLRRESKKRRGTRREIHPVERALSSEQGKRMPSICDEQATNDHFPKEGWSKLTEDHQLDYGFDLTW